MPTFPQRDQNLTDHNMETVDGDAGGEIAKVALQAATATAIATMATALTAISTYVDQLESYTDGLEGFVDGLETLVTATNTAVATLATHVDALEGYTDGVESKLDILHADVAKASSGAAANVSGSVTSATILASNANRIGAAVFNDSDATLYLLLASGTASSTAFSVKLESGDYYEVPVKYTGILVGVWSSATGAARVTEWT